MQNNREGLEFHKGAYLAVYNGVSVKFLSKAVRAYYMQGQSGFIFFRSIYFLISSI